MYSTIAIETIDRIRDGAVSVIRELGKSLPHCRYADLRVDVTESRGARAQNGTSRDCFAESSFSFGVRIIAGERIRSAGYWGQMLGCGDAGSFERIVRDGCARAYARAMANAEQKAQAVRGLGPFGGTLWDQQLAKIPPTTAAVPAEFAIDPRSVPLDAISAMARDASARARGCHPSIAYTEAAVLTALQRRLFVNSEGSVIDQSWAITEGVSAVVAQHGTVSQELSDVLGNQRGWESLAGSENAHGASFPDFCARMAKDAADLAAAPPLPTTEDDVVVVTDPHFNTLLAHEILGHPSEADRALKYETAYAGRTWFFLGLDENMIGKTVASPLVSAYSDPSLPGYGHYAFDDEGTPAERVVHIERGVFREFMNSRQTAAIMGSKPNGSFTTVDAQLVPLVRMSVTVFGAGERDPAELIGEVDHGYYVVGHRIPSISEARENFRISAQKVYEIRNGEIGRLFRGGGITADTRAYLMGVDAVGSDFKIFPIANCGKGQPMQSKRLGNGAPTMRSRARLAGPAA